MIRSLYSQTEEAKIRGYKPGSSHLMFLVEGASYVRRRDNKVEMYFLPDVYVMCEDCNGSRY